MLVFLLGLVAGMPKALACMSRILAVLWPPQRLRMHRFHIFLLAENDLRLFPMKNGAARLREKRRKQVEKYMRKAGPEKYHDLLILDFDVGCKVCH
jgi:hypothetical protein